jgi:hypothetical protein
MADTQVQCLEKSGLRFSNHWNFPPQFFQWLELLRILRLLPFALLSAVASRQPLPSAVAAKALPMSGTPRSSPAVTILGCWENLRLSYELTDGCLIRRLPVGTVVRRFLYRAGNLSFLA